MLIVKYGSNKYFSMAKLSSNRKMPKKEWTILFHLSEQKDFPKSISLKTGIEYSTVSTTLNNLQEMGLIQLMKTHQTYSLGSNIEIGKKCYSLSLSGKTVLKFLIMMRKKRWDLTDLRYDTPGPISSDIRAWIRNSRSQLKYTSARNDEKLSISRQTKTLTHSTLLEAMNDIKQHLNVLSQTHSNSNEELDLLKNKTHIGILTERHIQSIMKDDPSCINQLVAMAELPTSVYSLQKIKNPKKSAYLSNTNLRKKIATETVHTPHPVETNKELIHGFIDGDFDAVAVHSPIAILLSEQTDSKIIAKPSTAQRAFLVCTKDSLNSQSLCNLKSALSDVRENLVGSRWQYSHVMNYLTRVALEDFKEYSKQPFYKKLMKLKTKYVQN